MFGYRPDGRRISSIDPIVRITPYLMPMRCDAQVILKALRQGLGDIAEQYPEYVSLSEKIIMEE